MTSLKARSSNHQFKEHAKLLTAMSRVFRVAVATVVGVLFAAPIRGAEDQSSTDHCFSNLFEGLGNSSHMRFTKEVVALDYAILGAFKSLHCCAKGYRSIEWLKDGKAYPWTSDISSLILYPEASNQTIYTRQVQVADAGNYTCVLRNDTHKITHQISLNVQGNQPDLPLATYHPRDQVAELGTSARFYCEAFVGKVGLPDAKSDISWYQIKDGLEEEIDGLQILDKTRENGQNIGSYLKIPQVQIHNYGRYLCRVEFNSAAHRLEMYATLFSAPMVVEINRTFTLYHTLAAVLLATVAAIIVLSICCLARPWCLRRSSCKNQCQMENGVSKNSSGDSHDYVGQNSVGPRQV